MRIFFGKISDKLDKTQIEEGYYRAPKESSWFNGIQPGDYAYIIGGSKIQLWQAKEWTQKEGDDVLQFEIIHNNLGINTKYFTAIKYFSLTVELVVLTVRSTGMHKKAFFPIVFNAEIFTEEMLRDINTYKDENTYRKIHLRSDQTKPSHESIDIQLYKEDGQWKLFHSSFISRNIINSFRDNTNMLGNGQTKKDKAIKIIISPENADRKIPPKQLSILNIYDLFCCDYRTKIADEYPKGNEESEDSVELIKLNPEDKTIRYWLIAPGQQAMFWDKWQEEGVIAIGWNKLGDLRRYSDKESLTNKLKEAYGNDSSMVNNTVTTFSFCHLMSVGDYVFAKKGTSEILGFGQITSDYIYDSTRDTFHHVRHVNWLSKGNWTISKDEDAGIPLKTLTDITNHTNFLDKMLPLVTGSQSDIATSYVYWWLNANPKIWNFSDIKIGEKQTYTTHNEKGNKRRIYKYFTQVQPGDLIIGYLASPDREITAICRITKGLHENREGESIEFEKIEDITIPVTLEELKDTPGLSNCEPLINNQGSLFKLSGEEYDLVRSLIDEKNEPERAVEVTPYPIETALEGLFFKREEFEDILEVLRFKKNIILQGAPGVGKTFIAQRLAFTLMKEKAPQRVQMIQFHQSYSYEDFIQGYRPNDKENFTLKNGLFHEFCKKAQRDPDNKYVFIIDEINRGNLSKIFGELMMLIEADKRGKEFAVPLTYAQAADEKFYIPENLYLIGTMNTADRSLAMVDYALRRRFSFISLSPKFDTTEFRVFMKSKNIDTDLIEKIIARMTALNAEISKDEKNLGIGYQIGHSFFCPTDGLTTYDHAWYQRVVRHEIRPLLDEYWFDNLEDVDKHVKNLLD
jgi:5-methylcytosine-specific restriction protein B